MFKKLLKKGKAQVYALMAAVTAMVAVPGAAMAAPIDFSTTPGLGVSVTDVVGTGMSFANMFNDYTMLILAVIMAPVAVGFLIWLWRKLPRFGGRS